MVNILKDNKAELLGESGSNAPWYLLQQRREEKVEAQTKMAIADVLETGQMRDTHFKLKLK